MEVTPALILTVIPVIILMVTPIVILTLTPEGKEIKEDRIF